MQMCEQLSLGRWFKSGSVENAFAIMSPVIIQWLKKVVSEVGFEPTPTDVDCDLNAAP